MMAAALGEALDKLGGEMTGIEASQVLKKAPGHKLIKRKL